MLVVVQALWRFVTIREPFSQLILYHSGKIYERFLFKRFVNEEKGFELWSSARGKMYHNNKLKTSFFVDWVISIAY